MKKRNCSLTVLLAFLCHIPVSSASSCSTPEAGKAPNIKNYIDSLKKREPEDLLRANATEDFLIANQFCRDVYNFYESRAKCAESWKLGVGIGGGIFGFLGSMMIAAGTGGAAPGIAAGIAGVASVTLGNAEKGPLGTSAYEVRRISVGKSREAAVASYQNAKSAREIHELSALMIANCPTPTQ